MRRRDGFTLLEILLATVILAIMMALVYGVVVSTVQAQKRIDDVTGASEIGPAILTQVRADLEGSFLPPKEGEFFLAVDRKANAGGRDRIDFVSGVLAYGSDREGEEPRFHGFNEIGYQVVDSKTDPNVGVLYRREDLFIDAEPLKGGKLIELYERVRHFDLQFWDGEKWKPDWSSKREKNKLPQAVRIELKILVEERGETDREHSFTSTVVFPR